MEREGERERKEASSLPMQPVDVLRDAGGHAAQPLQIGDGDVRRVRPRVPDGARLEQLFLRASVDGVDVTRQLRRHLPEEMWLADKGVVLAVHRRVVSRPEAAR